ncbi:HET-domain-containing protein [Ophiobolus disseminans]|uniref:HET-domain-containing protein n=1 Tax=Ophiobolus disseminans TaxID=1469910 RepID=A0A6A7A8W8_9PLEO|nr:HET-domain-containing protein [Ophiobolus disseminans]
MIFDQFVYHPLQAGHIRVLILSHDAPARMRHIDLKHRSGPKYVALSYTWGANTQTHPYECDAQNLPVRENLLHALSQLRHIVDTPIWIDAMCINQSDEIEKLAQIQMMTEIYRGAQEVLIWLGPETLDTKIAVTQLRDITAMLKAQKVWSPDAGKILPTAFINGIRHLMTCPWWPRLWVLQEATLAREAIFVCGSHSVPWKLLSSLAKQIKRLDLYSFFSGQDRGPEYCDGFTEILNVEIVRHMHSATLGTDLIRVCRQRICFDPCDRVYGVIGLMVSAVRVGFTWEPGEKVDDLYPPFVQILLQLDPTATMLSFTDTTERNPNLPSWCPDLHYRSIANVLADHEGYHAGFKILSSTEFDWKHSERKPKQLRTKSIIIDAVKTVFPEHWPDGADALNDDNRTVQQTNIHLLQEYIKIAKSFVVEKELWRIFIGNILGNEDSKLNLLSGFSPIHDRLASRRSRDEASAHHLAFQELQTWSPSAGEASPQMQNYVRKARRVCLGRKLFTTAKGRVGLGPTSVAVGDEVCIIKCARVPFLLSRHGEERGEYRLRGEAYVHGLMHGEYLKVNKKFDWVTIV